MTSAYDAWKTTDRAGDLADALHFAFENSQEYMDAYVDYCDDFVGSSTYERAFEKFVGEDEREYGYDEQWDGSLDEPDSDRDSFDVPDEPYVDFTDPPDERDWEEYAQQAYEDAQQYLDDAVRYYQMHPEAAPGYQELDEYNSDPYMDNG